MVRLFMMNRHISDNQPLAQQEFHIYHQDKQWRLGKACTVSPQPTLHTHCGPRGSLGQSCPWPYLMAVHLFLRNNKPNLRSFFQLTVTNRQVWANVDQDQTGPGHVKMCLMPYVNNEGVDQPAHPRSLISTFVVHCLDSIMPLVSISEISRLSSRCSWADWLESYLVKNLRRHIFTWCGSDCFWRSSLIRLPFHLGPLNKLYVELHYFNFRIITAIMLGFKV